MQPNAPVLERIRHLYVHIPFCPSKCEYCAFVTHVGSLKLVPDYLASLVREANTLLENSRSGRLHTVYFGGGTPSMLQPDQIEGVLSHIQAGFGFAPDCEITIEAHPLTVDQHRLSKYHEAGVTRVSFGAESMSDIELKRLGRRHTTAHVEQAVRWARNAGLASVALDLMYGLPGQTSDSWRITLERALALQTDHLSLYPLSVEPRTVFRRKVARGQLELPDDELVVGMYREACALLRHAGYEHYEVANWARPGKRCAHNMAYWMNREVLAMGVGAHGYVKPFRTENVSHTKHYIDAVSSGRTAVHHREFIGPAIELVETVVLGLRLLTDGIDLDQIGRQFGINAFALYEAEVAELTTLGLLHSSSGRLKLPEAAVPLANEVWERFVAPGVGVMYSSPSTS